MKKIVSLLLVVVLVCIMATGAVFAAEPRWTNVVAIIPTISDSSDIYGVTVTGVPGTSKIECSVSLYKVGWFGTTSYVDGFSSTQYSQSGDFSDSASIGSGTYRMNVTLKVTANGDTETINREYESSF